MWTSSIALSDTYGRMLHLAMEKITEIMEVFWSAFYGLSSERMMCGSNEGGSYSLDRRPVLRLGGIGWKIT